MEAKREKINLDITPAMVWTSNSITHFNGLICCEFAYYIGRTSYCRNLIYEQSDR